MYENRLTKQSIFFSPQTLWLLLLFFAVRVGSFFLNGHLIIQGILVFTLLMLLGILFFKNPTSAWCLVLTEIFLGGSGHYLEFLGLSIRTLFIAFFIFLWLAQLLSQGNLKQTLNIHNTTNILLLILALFLTWSFFNGLHNNHTFAGAFADLIPFSFLLLLFPSYYFFTDEKIQDYLVRLIAVFLMGTSIFSLTTFLAFSTGLLKIHDVFYQWYRDVDLGKITDLGLGFFRIVEPMHLVIVPIILLIASLLMRNEKHNNMWRVMLSLATLTLVLNLSRGYFLALLVGLVILKFKHSWKSWLKVSSVTIAIIVVLFSGISLLASGGKTFGWEQFGVRLKSLTTPQIEISTDTRMMILPAILDVIKTNPFLGIGLGSTVTFMNIRNYDMITTSQYDWGYLEMWAEMGIFGALSLLIVYLYAIYKIVTKIKNIPDWHDFDVGLLAGLVAFLIMNITIPALFHVFGILFLMFTILIGIKHTSIFDRTTTVLYRVFNRL